MADKSDLLLLTDAKRREEVSRLATQGLLTPAHIMQLSARRDSLALLTAAERLKDCGYIGLEYHMARYELERDSEVSVRVPILEDLLQACYDRKYMLELAGLYCAQGNAVKARRICARLQTYFKDGREVEEAQRLLALLQEGKLKEAARAYSAYAAPAPVVPSAPGGPAKSPSPRAKPGPAAPRLSAGAAPGREPAKSRPPARQGPAKSNPPAQQEPGKSRIPQEVERAFRGMIGMEEVKIRLSEIYWRIQLQREREQKLNAPAEPVVCNFILMGNPGTGKTTVARIIARLLFKLGIRKEDKLVEADRSGLVEGYIGQTAPKTVAKLEEAAGGTLFIDEAYTLYKADSAKDFGAEAIDALLKYMEDHRDSLTVILAGYQDRLDEMFNNSNPGFVSRFQYKITLRDYTNQELLQVAQSIAAQKKYILAPGAEGAFLRRIERMRLGDTFGNARDARTIVEKAISAQSARLAGRSHSNADLSLLLPEDFEDPDLGKERLEDLLAELDALTGLEKAKEQVRSLVRTVRIRRQNQAQGRDHGGAASLHTAFLGNPGTGKTTMARLLGRICRALEVLKRGEIFVECGRADLVAGHAGQTAGKVKAKVKEAMGGVLFIDEAYSLVNGKDDSFGREAVDCLIAEMENHRGDLMVILAGYTREMRDFFAANPGFQSRVPNLIDFEDYSKEQLMDIFASFLKKDSFTLEEGWRQALAPVLSARLAAGGREFANARGARTLADEAKQHWADRGGGDDKITLQDLVWELGDQDTAEQLLEQLNALEGLERVKKEVNSIIRSMQARRRDLELGLNRADSPTSLHMAFLGNPGTGKTTVARILGKLYTALGVLPGGALVQCGRADLVAGYSGQTAGKVKAKVKEAMGGVLFIDEAYSLVYDGDDPFGREAVDTLLQEMENHRAGFMVILAGYTERMDKFFSTNPGLRSRVPTQIIFDDYGPDQLLSIFRAYLEKQGFLLPPGWQEIVGPQLERGRNKEGFANARNARNLAERVIRRRDERVADLPEADYKQQVNRIAPEDLREKEL